MGPSSPKFNCKWLPGGEPGTFFCRQRYPFGTNDHACLCLDRWPPTMAAVKAVGRIFPGKGSKCFPTVPQVTDSVPHCPSRRFISMPTAVRLS